MSASVASRTSISEGRPRRWRAAAASSCGIEASRCRSSLAVAASLSDIPAAVQPDARRTSARTSAPCRSATGSHRTERTSGQPIQRSSPAVTILSTAAATRLHALPHLALPARPAQESVDGPNVARDSELGQRPPPAAYVQLPGREPVQSTGRQLLGVVDPLLGAEGQEHLVQRVAVRLPTGPDGQAPRPAALERKNRNSRSSRAR